MSKKVSKTREIVCKDCSSFKVVRDATIREMEEESNFKAYLLSNNDVVWSCKECRENSLAYQLYHKE